MRTSIKSFALAALLAGLVGGMPGIARAIDFLPLGEGVLPSGMYLQDFKLTLYPGETIPWHYHPGLFYGVIVSGVVTEEHGCGEPPGTLAAGSAFSETDGVIHRIFNNGTEPVVIMGTFIVPAQYAGYTGTIYVTGPRCERDHGHDHDHDHDQDHDHHD